MNYETERTGRCLCGAVHLSVNSSEMNLGACHCAICRKWAGGPFLEVECGADVIFEGSENIEVFESSNRAQRGFCKICGTHLFVKAIPGDEYGIPPGVFDEEQGIRFNRQVFIDHKPSYYSFSDSTENITSTYIYEHSPETQDDT